MIESIPTEGWVGSVVAIIVAVGGILKKTGNLRIGRKANVQNNVGNPTSFKCASHDMLCRKVDSIQDKVEHIGNDVSDVKASIARMEGYLQGRNNR